jgi:hypothetical protein
MRSLVRLAASAGALAAAGVAAMDGGVAVDELALTGKLRIAIAAR